MLKNFRKLFSANIVAGILGVMTLTLVSRGLGPEVYGMAAVTISIGAFIEQVAGFQAWQAVTRYATRAQVDGDSQQFWHVVSLGLALDALGCIVAAVIGAVVVLLFPVALGLPVGDVAVVALYMLSLTFAVSGTPLAVLRIYERYDRIGQVLIFAAVLKLLLVAIACTIKLNLGTVLAIFGGTMAAQHLIFLWIMLRLARREGAGVKLTGLRLADLRAIPGFGQFVGSVYLSTTVRNIAQELDTIILSAASGPAVAGQYKLAKQYGSVILRAIEPAQQVIYPRMAAMVASKDITSLFNLLRKITLFGSLSSLFIYCCYIIAGEYVVLLVVGREFEMVPDFLAIFLIAIMLFSILFYLRPLVLSFGKPHATLAIYIIATLVFLGTYFLLRGRFGAYAMMIAQVSFYMSWAIGMLWVSVRSWRTLVHSSGDKV